MDQTEFENKETKQKNVKEAIQKRTNRHIEIVYKTTYSV